MRQCLACGQLFEPEFSIVCKECEPLWARSYYAKILSDMVEVLDRKECPVCGNDFWWSKNKCRVRKYCSAKCAAIAKKRKDKERSRSNGRRREETV